MPSPSKWIDIKKFQPIKKYEGVFKVKQVMKPNKPDLWFLKTYGGNAANKVENQAVGGDIFRFVLGKGRAAKSQVAHKDQKAVSVVSQFNRAGFESVLEMKKKFKLFNSDQFVNYINGKGDVDIIEVILTDFDGLSNDGNVGANFKTEISRIDYGQAFSDSYSSTDEIEDKISGCFFKNERAVNQTNDEKAINRFYKSILKIALLNQTLIGTILNRHIFAAEDKLARLNFLSFRISIVISLLAKSNAFKEFLHRFDCNELYAECEDFFKHEKKHDPMQFSKCMQSIKYSVDELNSYLLESCKLSKSFR